MKHFNFMSFFASSCRCLGSMPFHVPLQLNSLFASVIALSASNGFLLSVQKHVSPQMAWKPEREVALITCKVFFTSMLPFMNLDTTGMVG